LLPHKNFEELLIPVHINAVDLNAGKMHTFSSGCLIAACLGSTALTPLFRPIEHQGMLLSDGGFMNNLPTAPLKQYGDPILASNVMPIVAKEPQGILKITKRSLFMLTQSNVVNHLDQCDIYITSEKLLQYKLFKIENLDDMFALGYECAQAQLSQYH
jgi:NTE family protein